MTGAPGDDRPTTRAYRSSSALRWPARSTRRPVYLSGGQQGLLLVVRLLAKHGGATVSLDRLATLSGSTYTRADGVTVPNRGRTSDRLARLRMLGLVGYEGHRGRTGWIRVWIRAGLHHGPSTSAYRRRAIGNDSTSSPSGRFLTRERGLEAAWTLRTGGPPGVGAVRRPDVGPRRGRRPPRILYTRCPAGHRALAELRSWEATHRSIRATWTGVCRRCDLRTLERVDLELPAPDPRPWSPAELADPSIRRRRELEAAAMLRAGGLPLELRERLERDYRPLDSPAGQPAGVLARAPRPASYPVTPEATMRHD